MTLILALKYKEGVVVGSDSRVSYGEAPLMREEALKIETIKKFAISGVGLAGPLDRIIGEIKTTFNSSPRSTFKDLVEISENVMWNFYQKYAKRIQEEDEEVNWTLILMSKDKIYHVLTSGWSEEERRYSTDGSGELYAEYILKQRYKTDMSESQAKELLVYTIDQTSKIDPNVGGRICLTVIDENSIREVREEEVCEILESVTEPIIPEREIQKIVHDIVDKRRWLNTAFNRKFGFKLFKQNEYAISEIQNYCRNETDFTSRITALALLIDSINSSELKKQLNTQQKGSINLLEAFFKEKYQDFNMNLIVNLRDIMSLRSKKMPIHEDDPKIIQVILRWEQKIPPNWSSLWKQALIKYEESLSELQKLLSI